MFRRIFKLSFLLPAIALAAILSGCESSSSDYTQIQGFAQGGTYHIICRVPEGTDEKALASSIDSILLAIDNSMSGYNKGSVLSKINAGEDVPLDPLFVECFLQSKAIWAESDGAFDPSAAPLFDLWGFGFETGSAVSQNSIDSAMNFVGMEKFTLDRKEDGLHLVMPEGSKLNFNAIAQGFSCDVVADFLQGEGCEDYLVEIGREIVCKGISSRGDLWNIALDKPVDGNMEEGKDIQEVFAVTDRGVVTSGNYRKFYIKDGKKYAHIIDPRTGSPVDHSLLSATVFADDATTADAYATWFMVIGLDEARNVLSERPELDAYLVYSEDGEMKVWKTEGCNTEYNN